MMSRNSSSLFMKENRRSFVRLMMHRCIQILIYIKANFINESVFPLRKLPLTGPMGLWAAAF